MTPRYELASPAEPDLEDIFFEVYTRHGLVVAERAFENLLRTSDLPTRMPEMGRHGPEFCRHPIDCVSRGRRSAVRPTHVARIARASRSTRSRVGPTSGDAREALAFQTPRSSTSMRSPRRRTRWRWLARSPVAMRPATRGASA